jgi:hypothetical protein
MGLSKLQNLKCFNSASCLYTPQRRLYFLTGKDRPGQSRQENQAARADQQPRVLGGVGVELGFYVSFLGSVETIGLLTVFLAGDHSLDFQNANKRMHIIPLHLM